MSVFSNAAKKTVSNVKAVTKKVTPSVIQNAASKLGDAVNKGIDRTGKNIAPILGSVTGTLGISPGKVGIKNQQSQDRYMKGARLGKILSTAGMSEIPGMIKKPTESPASGPAATSGANVGATGTMTNQSLIDDLITKQSGAYGDLGTKQQTDLANLIAKQKGEGQTQVGDFANQRKQRMTELSDLLNQSTARQMSLKTPGILEDLSSRGLLHSSGVGENLAREQANLTAQSNEQLQAQGLSDLDKQLALQQQNQGDLWGLEQGGVTNQNALGLAGLQNTTGLQTAGVERQFSLEDQAKADALARELAQKQADSQKVASNTGLVSNLSGIGLDWLLNKK